jgi:hypothetical protein
MFTVIAKMAQRDLFWQALAQYLDDIIAQHRIISDAEEDQRVFYLSEVDQHVLEGLIKGIDVFHLSTSQQWQNVRVCIEPGVAVVLVR